MSHDDHDIEKRLEQNESLLTRIAQAIGLDSPRPEDPYKAHRWDIPLLGHVSELRDSVHDLNNNTQILNGLLNKVTRQITESAEVSRENREGIRELGVISKEIEAQATAITAILGVGLREKPLLMRDLFWLETNTIEIMLFALTFGQSIIFMVGDAKLMNSAMFRALSVICPYPTVWGIALGLMSLFSVTAFACRKRIFRNVAAFMNTVYFGVTGFMPLLMSPGVLGWWQHLVAFAFSFWVLTRGPSQAIR